MVTVQQIIDYLQAYCKPEDEFLVMSSHYDGSSEVYEHENPVLVIGYNHITICPDDIYHVKEAQYDGVFCTIHADGTIE